jgi:hypothetical protein
MSGLLASLAFIGALIALGGILTLLLWLTYYCLSRLGIGD